MTEGRTTPMTDLPVLLPVRPPSVPALRFRAWHGPALVAAMLLLAPAAAAQASPEELSIIGVIVKWMPLLLTGFGFNLLISVLSMALGTIVGLGLGLLQLSEFRWLSRCAWALTQFFRNAPWLVLLFFAMYLILEQVL
ncbi:hypothetical protein EH240_24925 [Mesorhizobium tamadayense]|uniref:ABC transporter permease subunit n=1 Tax=Mesorhizobium tamadayense TaxID=425306 RepID=A0A3P3FAP1_9HYPH|nr:ABC transporter permease subunit [Mesorhizobium tamadayense]RRH95252.1 hypothetical protein EH240_24925 [Mesorhizobium tamadayense]